ncbi:MAG: type II secretion system F family protein [Peptococcaceae bacterium]|jgi:tight adherence protein C|nr:type II secretion system F family protein [Peptococcaceae bacterium]
MVHVFLSRWLTVTFIWLTALFITGFFLAEFRAGHDRLMTRVLFGFLPKAFDARGVPFFKRFSRTLLGFAGLLARRRALVTLQDRLDAAGNPWDMTAAELTGVKLIISIGGASVTGYLFYLASGPVPAAFMAIVAFLLFNVLPSFLLSRQVTRRRTEMERQLPNFMDIVTLAVESGQGFDAALTTAVDRFAGPLAREFAVALREMRFGLPRRAALMNIVGRNKEIKSLRNLLIAIVQAERFGMSLAGILRVQSGQLRLEKRQRAEEAAQKMPVKMLIPLIFLILPALFTVILGPAVIMVLKAGIL